MSLARGALYAVLPLRDIVVFPHMIVPLFVGREKSVRALEDAMKDDKQILLIAQKDGSQDDPGPDDIYGVGTVSTVLQLLKLPDGTVKVLVEGGQRARIAEFAPNREFVQAYAEVLDGKPEDERELQALARAVVSQFEEYVKLNKKIPPEVLVSLNQIENYGKLVDTVASHLTIKVADKQALLEIDSVLERLERVYALIEGEIGVMQVEKRIRGRVKRQMEKTQREYYLNEQMKAIQKELGDGGEGRDEAGEYEEKIKNTKLAKEARDKALAEVKKLRSMSPMSAESTVVRNYLDWMLGIPWKKRTKLKRDIGRAQDILDADHFGLEKVKERIVEYLAVQARSRKLKGPILCLVGPPGVGKTSLGKSVARATGRNFVRMSLGGVRDEAEIRGHRRTYIGSMPGKIVQGMKKAKSSNPLFLLDEVDKLGADWRGDPSSALLEVLDPEQNSGLQRPLSRSRLRSLGRHVRHHREHDPHPATTAGPHGGDPDLRLHRRREGRHRLRPSHPQAVRGPRPEEGRVGNLGRRPAQPHPLLHARGRRQEPRAGDRPSCSARPSRSWWPARPKRSA